MLVEKTITPFGHLNQWHIEDGKLHIVNTFDAQYYKDEAAKRRQLSKSALGLKHEMTIPIPMVFELIANGELGEEAFSNGSICIDKASLDRLKKKYPALVCS